jgi:hypothetical protein
VAQIAWPHGFSQLLGTLLNTLKLFRTGLDFHDLHLTRGYPILNFSTHTRFEHHGSSPWFVMDQAHHTTLTLTISNNAKTVRQHPPFVGSGEICHFAVAAQKNSNAAALSL